MSIELRFEYDEETGMAYTYVNGDDVKGTLNRMDTLCIVETAQKYLKDGGVYLETGSYLGCSSILVALVSSKATVYAHDIWVSDFDMLTDSSVPPPKTEGDYFKIFYDNVRKNKLQNRVIPIRGDSAYTVSCVHEDESVSMAFIDGDHSEDGILRDLNAVYPKIKPGGVILCHDCVDGSEARKGLEKFGKEFIDVPGTYGMVMLIKK
jgi:predicted O-methyltransferase YrrM